MPASRSASPQSPSAAADIEPTGAQGSAENLETPTLEKNEEDEESNKDEDDTDGEAPSAEPSGDEPVASTSASASAPAPATGIPSTVPTAGKWQAIWSPAHNAYYFFNSETQETTWSNPLQPQPDAVASSSGGNASPPDPSASTSTAPLGAAVPPHLAALYSAQAAAAAQGIDPALAYLDPSLASLGGPSAGAGAGYGATAKFNARTGAFAKVDARDPSHLSEFERAKRMSEFYFDVGAWEQDLEKRKLEEAQEEEEGGRKKKKLTKKDLVSPLLVDDGHTGSF